MATNRNVRAEYDSLGDAANRFGQEAERIDKIAQNLARSEDSLRRNNWVGQGADAFYREMDGSVLPAFRRLEKALEESSRFMKLVSKIFHDAEQEAAAIVGKLQQAAGSGGAAGGAGGALGGGMFGGLGGALGGGIGGSGGAAGGAGGSGGGLFGGLGGSGGAAGAAAGGSGGDLASFPGTLQGLLQNAVQGLGLNPNGATLEIDIQKASGMPDTGNQYGIPNPAAAGGGSGAGAGGPTPAASTPPQTPQSSGGGGSGGGDSGFGGGGSAYGGGSGLQMGGGTGQPSSPAYWFGATVGTPVTASNAASISPGAAPATPGGNSLGSLLAEIGATAGAAIVGAVGKSVLGKGILH